MKRFGKTPATIAKKADLIKCYPFAGKWLEAFGQPQTDGAWLIWGNDSNATMIFATTLANYLGTFAKVLYVSAQYGYSQTFVDAMIKGGISENDNNIKVTEYVPIDELDAVLKRQRAAKVVVLDNVTVYRDELKGGKLRELLVKHKNKLFIFLADEERKEPYSSTAKACRRVANIDIHVQNGKALITGRCPGGEMNINNR